MSAVITHAGTVAPVSTWSMTSDADVQKVTVVETALDVSEVAMIS